MPEPTGSPQTPTAESGKPRLGAPLTSDLISRLGMEEQVQPEGTTPTETKEPEKPAEDTPAEPAPEGQEGTTENAPDHADSEVVETLFEKGANGEDVPIKVADVIRGAEFPIKFRSRVEKLNYEDVIRYAQIGRDADRKYQQVRKLQENYQADVQNAALNLFNAEMARINGAAGVPGETETPGNTDQKVPRGLTREELAAELDRRDQARQLAEMQRADAMKSDKITNDVLSGFKDKMKDVPKLYSTFERAIEPVLKARVQQAFMENGRQPITHEEYQEILAQTAAEEYAALKPYIPPSKPAPTQKKPPITPPIKAGGGSAPIAPQPVVKGQMPLNVKKLTTEQILAMGRHTPD